MFGVTAIERNSGREQRYISRKEIAAPAMVAVSAVSTMPANPNPLTILPWLHSFTDKIDNSDDFMSRHTRILNTWPRSILD